MNCKINLSRFKDISDNIIKIENNYIDKNLKLHYRSEPAGGCIMNIIRYLNNTDWKNFKFNEYSVRKNDENYIITLHYIAPKIVFSK
jgi:hypothetical protein